MTLDEIENRIESIYRMFHVVAPGVRPQETGELGALWALFDREVGNEV